MGTQPPIMTNIDTFTQSDVQDLQPKLQTAQSFTVNLNDQDSTFDKQQQSSALEIEILKKNDPKFRERVKIFSQIAPEDIGGFSPEQPICSHLHRESLPLSSIVFDQEEEDEDERLNAERVKYSMAFQQMLMKQSVREAEQIQKQYELFLTIDDKWLHQLRKREKDNIDFEKAYRPVTNISPSLTLAEVNRYKRVGYDGRKIQILFRQQVPRRAKYFYQIQLFSYNPNKKCQLTLGFVDYFKAQNNIHSRDCCIEQSYTIKQKLNLNLSNEEESKEVELNKKVRVEISREEGNAFMAVCINGEQVYWEELRKDMVDNPRAVVPYVQTQFQGLDFGWSMPTTFTL